jgi:hypothetical protein
MKTHTLEEITDKYIGRKGTAKRDAFEEALRLDVLEQTTKDIRKERHRNPTPSPMSSGRAVVSQPLI